VGKRRDRRVSSHEQPIAAARRDEFLNANAAPSRGPLMQNYGQIDILKRGTVTTGHASEEGSLADRLRGLRARFDVIVRHPATDSLVAGLEDVLEREAGHFTKRYLDRGYTVEVRNRRTGRVAVELPATEIGEHRRAKLIEEAENNAASGGAEPD
jgi:hypothetical protein